MPLCIPFLVTLVAVVLATSAPTQITGKLVFVSTYRRLTEVMDAESLRDFAKKWTADILSANEAVAKSTG